MRTLIASYEDKEGNGWKEWVLTEDAETGFIAGRLYLVYRLGEGAEVSKELTYHDQDEWVAMKVQAQRSLYSDGSA